VVIRPMPTNIMGKFLVKRPTMRRAIFETHT
jgi:hypothetical protein